MMFEFILGMVIGIFFGFVGAIDEENIKNGEE